MTVTYMRLMQRLQRRLPPLHGLLGQDRDGLPLLLRLDAPAVNHVLIAGTSGSRKTVLMQQFLLSLALFYRQGQVQLSLIDPKQSGLRSLAGLPHLWQPMASTGKEIRHLLAEVVALMEKRNRQSDRWPKVVVAVNEVAEMARIAGPPAMAALTRIARRGRETGFHLVVSTQQPTSSLLEPLLKGNFPTRIVGTVANSEDALTATGVASSGAEKLGGSGQFLAVVQGKITHFQSAELNEEDIRRAVAALSSGLSGWAVRQQLGWGESGVKQQQKEKQLWEKSLRTLTQKVRLSHDPLSA